MEPHNDIKVSDGISEERQDRKVSVKEGDVEVSEASFGLTPEIPVSKWRVRFSALTIIVTGTLTYLNSFEGAFIYDDLFWINSIYIRQLWPPWSALFASINMSRPLIGLALAINYQISGMNACSYHAVNLTVHIL